MCLESRLYGGTYTKTTAVLYVLLSLTNKKGASSVQGKRGHDHFFFPRGFWEGDGFYFVLFCLHCFRVQCCFCFPVCFFLSFLFRCATLWTPEAYLHDYRPLKSLRASVLAACGFMNFQGFSTTGGWSRSRANEGGPIFVVTWLVSPSSSG